MYPGLNAIRAFAFLAVFLIHVERLGGGYLGVIAFFVLSGFLITPILVGMRATLPARAYFARLSAQGSRLSLESVTAFSAFVGRPRYALMPRNEAFIGGSCSHEANDRGYSVGES